jgi:putative ABC transport system permease protein
MFWTSVLDDFRHAVRSLWRMPVVSAVVIASLAIGIGVNTVVFSWLEARVLKPLPGVRDGAAFLQIEPRTASGNYPSSSWREYLDLTERVRTLRDLLAFRIAPLYVGEPGSVERAFGTLVSANYFRALDVQPAAGRFFRPDEVRRPGGDPVAVISHGLWRRRFGGAPDVIGRSMRVNGVRLTIIGVTPDVFQGTVSGLNFDIWLPATLAPTITPGSRELEDRGVRGYSLLGRLQEGATRDQAAQELAAIMRQFALDYPETNRAVAADVLWFWDSPRGPQRLLTTALAVLQATMLLLLLAICGNTATLVLARASTRQREIGVRLTLGAGPWRVARLLLSETVLLAAIGTVIGAALAAWGTSALQLLPNVGFPLRFQTQVDWQGLAFASVLGVGCGLVVGAAAALHLARVDPQSALRAGAKTASRSPLRHALMGVQVALALVVLIVAGLFLQSFLDTRRIDPGFRREGVLLATYSFSGRDVDVAATRTFTTRLLERLRASTAVEGAAIASSVPLDIHGLPSRRFTVEGRRTGEVSEPEVSVNTVTPGYFGVMGIAFREGADFVSLNEVATAPQVIVNEVFATRYLAGVPPIGQRVQVRGRMFTVAGVVATTISNAFGEAPTPVLYFSYRDAPSATGEIHVRTRPGAESAVGRTIRRTVGELDAELPVFNVRTLTEHVETNLVLRRVPARMFAVLGPLLLVLASIGVYAVVAYSVSQRTTEIGVRVALGATTPRVVLDLVGESLRVVCAGLIAGWLIAFVLASELATMPTIDLAVFVGIPLLLFGVAAAACWQPARRAARIDPASALRQP